MSTLQTWWPHVTTALLALVSIFAAVHAVLRKRDVRSAAAWIGIVLFMPGVGALLYLLLGINRVSRAAARVRSGMQHYSHAGDHAATAEQLEVALPESARHLAGIARVLTETTGWPLVAGNAIDELRDGDEAYPAMLDAIAAAQHSVVLASYIFDNDPLGRRFAAALGDARDRGVAVRVLLDDAGARYSWPSIDRELDRRGVRVARFLPVAMPLSVRLANLRNHRKILVIDGRVGFTGGMNLRHACLLSEKPKHPTRDLHFRLAGPIVTELLDVFAEDWTFATGEILPDDHWPTAVARAGDVYARAVSDGPDDDLDHMRWAFHAALASARRSARIVTPYFLPDEPLITALNVASLRGVGVDIVLPERSNLRIVDWATRGELWKLLDHGCRVWWSPPPFDHSKLMVVDDAWALFGSSNWDPRSLRLNFELGVECYDSRLATQLSRFVDERIAAARRATQHELASAPAAARLRNATARLLSPYL